MAMMKRFLIGISILAFGICQFATAQNSVKFPLKPICADSMKLYDFFWYGLQLNANKKDSVSDIKFNWDVKPMAESKIAKKAQAWQKEVSQLNILGDVRGKAVNMAHALGIFQKSYELAQLTGQSKYIDMAERVLLNRLLPLCTYGKDPKSMKETNDILRTCTRMAYSVSGHDVYVNMLMRGSAHIKNDYIDFFLRCFNSSPWYYETSFTICENIEYFDLEEDRRIDTNRRMIFKNDVSNDSVDINFHIRIPSWVTGKDMMPNHTAKTKKNTIRYFVNGTPTKDIDVVDGYALIKGRWAIGDNIKIQFPTPIMRVTDEQNPGMVALQRGPLIYTIEDLDPSWKLDVDSPISHQFYKSVYETVFLYGEMDSDNGKKSFKAIPCYKFNQNKQIFIPVK